MQSEYLEMRGKELYIDGICIAEVTNIEGAMAISDRVSNYVAELQRKIEKLEHEKEKLILHPFDCDCSDCRPDLDEEDELEYCWVSGLPLDDCCCDECDPDYEYHPAPEFLDESEENE